MFYNPKGDEKWLMPGSENTKMNKAHPTTADFSSIVEKLVTRNNKQKCWKYSADNRVENESEKG